MPIEESSPKTCAPPFLTLEPPDTPSLLQAGVRDGRRRRRRRATAVGVSAAAVLALVATARRSFPDCCPTSEPPTARSPACAGGLATTGSATASATPKPTFTGTLPADHTLPAP